MSNRDCSHKISNEFFSSEVYKPYHPKSNLMALPKRTLNAGCGLDTNGTDFTDKYPQRPEVKKCDQDKDKFPYPDNTFDEVIFNGVIEHLRNQGFALDEIYRVLKKNGKLSMITDNANYWGWAVGKTHLGGYNEAKIFGSENKHYALFTSSHLIEQARASGFRNIKVRYYLIKAPKGRYFDTEFGLRHVARVLVKSLLSVTPLWRMGYSRMQLTAQK